jgi:hypothetical protein
MACDRPVHQRERCKSAESRINLLLGTPLRHCDVDETRDWSRHSNTKTIGFSNWQREHKKDFFCAQEGISCPRWGTFRTFQQVVYLAIRYSLLARS